MHMHPIKQMMGASPAATAAAAQAPPATTAGKPSLGRISVRTTAAGVQ